MNKVPISRGSMAWLCFVVLCITLSLGLWPFHAPHNDVTWLKRSNGVEFGRDATVLSRGPLQLGKSIGSIELWLQPKHWSSSATLLTLYRRDNHVMFSLRQSLTDLEVDSEVGNSRTCLRVGDALGPALRQSKPVSLTVTFAHQGLMVYRDGAFVKAAPGFAIPDGLQAGSLVVGDAIRQSDSFNGDILGLAIREGEFGQAVVLADERAWTNTGHPLPGDAALYLFNEKTGSLIHNSGVGGADLYIPEKYIVIDEFFLRPFWREFDFSGSYWRGNLKNIVGFVPTGIVFYGYLVLIRPRKRALLLTLIAGFLVSLTIEVLQSVLPTRDSGTTDLITNTLGTYLGVLCYRTFEDNW